MPESNHYIFINKKFKPGCSGIKE